MSPEALQVVELACRLRKHMDDEVPVIKQDPLAGLVTLRAHRQFAYFFQLLVNLIGDGLGLARVRRRADQEEIRKGSDFPQVKDTDV